MKHQEFIHLHGLLFKVGEHLTRDESIPDGVFVHYKTQPTRPKDIHRSKDAHATAVKLLSSRCCQVIDKHHQQTHSSTTELSPPF
ncbi:Uncharacterised protein family UPF0058 [Halorientalis persicus]|uniref:Uncharacterized protein family UPF0058 n=1 Tax=Halorientalis persicus TaxID=1367881 RepID=A0A1H8S8K3_9EURY|nr:Uncharacterised protein family UPF0058 [Halorientalis persicus]